MAPAEETTTSRSKVEAAGRLSSMECEPKTLTLDQIKFARVSTLHNTPSYAVQVYTGIIFSVLCIVNNIFYIYHPSCRAKFLRWWMMHAFFFFNG